MIVIQHRSPDRRGFLNQATQGPTCWKVPTMGAVRNRRNKSCGEVIRVESLL